ncbi:hypothetical protein BDQ12DRAFT_698364 [Crucibulum laeve]|uniref:AB hydrolase-1 domain-containing protein n=1 Tax=Crucibulum laeve TaxID=68775 RepID=A0A5C3MCT5_9AGAR|nr:hypothetical protein BDQ12DRAFT_698364 [Crucibulum laeve]
MVFQNIVVIDTGIEIAYVDSGAPSTQSSYITIIAIHGMCFTAPVFKRVQVMASRRVVRIVALNRRKYPGSTPFTAEELAVKDAWLADRGHEIATFTDIFSRENSLPRISDGGEMGGIILLGWSVGVGEANAAIAYAESLPDAVRTGFTSQIRALGAPIMLGLPMPEKNWAPFMVESIPAELCLPAFGQWVTSYFDHGDLSTHALDVLSYVLPSTSHHGTIYSMTKAEQADIIFDRKEVVVEGMYMFSFGTQLNFAYQRAFFDQATDKLFPGLKRSHLAGDQTASWRIAGLWVVEKEAQNRGRKDIKCILSKGYNHFMH